MEDGVRMKKGLQWSVTLAIIIAVATAIILYMFIGRFRVVSSEAADVAACTVSVEAASKAVVGRLIEVECPTQIVTIKRDAVYVSSLRKPDPWKYMTVNDARKRLQDAGNKNPTEQEALLEMAQYAIARLMGTCFKQFGAGTLDPFKSGLLWSGLHCVTCDQISFDASFKKNVGKAGIVGFLQYLKDNKYDDKQTFFDFLRPYKEQMQVRDAFKDGSAYYLYKWLAPAELQQGGRSEKVEAADFVPFASDMVITYMQSDSELLMRVFYVTQPQSLVFAWPLAQQPACDTVY